MTEKIKYPKNCIKVLDCGFVGLINSLGSDTTITNSARVSYGDGTKKSSNNKTLIRHLIRNKHTSPFEHVIFTFHVKAPIFIFRQWHRHRCWSYSEISGRYSVLPEECYVPDEENVTTQDPDNKQGGTDTQVPFNRKKLEEDWEDSCGFYPEYVGDGWSSVFEHEQFNLKKHYNSYIESGMRRELARINQPVSQYSEMYATVDLHNLFHFLKLRMDKHAQWEIRQYANALFELIKPIVPEACQAFEDYILNSITLTKLDIEALQEFLHYNLSGSWGCLENDPEMIECETKEIRNKHFSNKREEKEFIEKLKILLAEVKSGL